LHKGEFAEVLKIVLRILLDLYLERKKSAAPNGETDISVADEYLSLLTAAFQRDEEPTSRVYLDPSDVV
jgi:hypothetical protein